MMASITQIEMAVPDAGGGAGGAGGGGDGGDDGGAGGTDSVVNMPAAHSLWLVGLTALTFQ